jgi:hypothetical protein
MSSTSSQGKFKVRLKDVIADQDLIIREYDTEAKAKAFCTRENKTWGRQVATVEIHE